MSGALRPRYGLVCFDFWFTLFTDARPGAARHDHRVDAFARALAESGQPVAREQVARVMREEWARYNQVHFEQARTLSNRERVFDMTGRLGCRPLPDDLLGRLDRELAASLFAGPPVLVPGMAELLRDLAPLTALAVVSDTSYSPGWALRRLLADEGVYDCFSAAVFSDELGFAKPDPRVFERVARDAARTGVPAVHVGDREATDVKGAKAAGFDAILFLGAIPERYRRPPGQTAADVTAYTVADLRAALLED